LSVGQIALKYCIDFAGSTPPSQLISLFSRIRDGKELKFGWVITESLSAFLMQCILPDNAQIHPAFGNGTQCGIEISVPPIRDNCDRRHSCPRAFTRSLNKSSEMISTFHTSPYLGRI